MAGPYYFTDVSHHKGELDMQTFADAGHRIVISKASDNYYLKDRDGNYYYDEDHHVDCYWVDNHVNARRVGLGSAGYHFVRWDRPIGTEALIVEKNLQYYKGALLLLPPEHQSKKVAILDMEQHDEQMEAIGITGPTEKMQRMTKAIVEAYLKEYEHVIIYMAWWWWRQYLTEETQIWLSERVSIWVVWYCEADELVDNKPPNPEGIPWVPAGFKAEYATTVEDMVGKVFARQFTSAGRYPGITSGIDTNLTCMPKDQLFRIMGDGSVDPPEPPEPPVDPSCFEKIKALIVAVLACLAGKKE